MDTKEVFGRLLSEEETANRKYSKAPDFNKCTSERDDTWKIAQKTMHQTHANKIIGDMVCGNYVEMKRFATIFDEIELTTGVSHQSDQKTMMNRKQI